ncbi:MAG: 3-phosphoshikimate 1-carboxyvinyltransferase [Acidobacteria bacterium]|nr:3-phosphoshikimate 1-carboxyvinyltransferase [Acidobacteriota bacterium]
MNWIVEPARRLSGAVVVPGDKSISHRAVLLASIADGESVVTGLADGEDVASSVAAMRALGVEVDHDGTDVRILGRGLDGLRSADQPIDCGNSGTTMRLLAGLLAGQGFTSTLTGDASLLRRPMRRVAEPLLAMGASVQSSRDGTAPLEITGAGRLRAITFRPEVASAQVKSCVLLAGLYADGPTTVAESAITRDHTERLLAAMGAEVSTVADGGGARVTIEPGPRLGVIGGRVPGDTSAAAYWLVGATLLEGSRLLLPGVGLNPTRAAIVDLLVDWGADVVIERVDDWCGEPVVNLRIRGVGAALTGGAIDPDMVPGLIDELPLIAALGASTTDGVEIRGAAELRAKESDRIATTAAALRALGVDVDEYPDGLAVAGGQTLGSGSVDAAGDHRIGLAMAAVALAARGPVTIENAETMAVSYPGFATALESVVER